MKIIMLSENKNVEVIIWLDWEENDLDGKNNLIIIMMIHNKVDRNLMNKQNKF